MQGGAWRLAAAALPAAVLLLLLVLGLGDLVGPDRDEAGGGLRLNRDARVRAVVVIRIVVRDGDDLHRDVPGLLDRPRDGLRDRDLNPARVRVVGLERGGAERDRAAVQGRGRGE